jgi:hypothetical protein
MQRAENSPLKWTNGARDYGQRGRNSCSREKTSISSFAATLQRQRLGRCWYSAHGCDLCRLAKKGSETVFPKVGVRHLHAVVVLAENLNITGCAHRLHTTQAAFSKQANELDEENRLRLFTCDPRRLRRRVWFPSLARGASRSSGLCDPRAKRSGLDSRAVSVCRSVRDPDDSRRAPALDP